MASLNKVLLIGYLTADPELKQTQSGIAVCSFRIGVSRRFSKDKESDFIDIVTWRQQAEFVSKYFRKGSPILVVGSLQGRSWTDQNNQMRYTLEVVADEVSFVESKGGNSSYGQSAPAQGGSMSGAPSYESNAGFNQQPSFTPDNTSAKYEDLSSDDDLPF